MTTSDTTTRDTTHLGAIRAALDVLGDCRDSLAPDAHDIERDGITDAMTMIREHAEAMAAARDHWHQTATSNMRHIRELASERDAAQEHAEAQEASIERLHDAIRWFEARRIDRYVTARINRANGDYTDDELSRWEAQAREAISKEPPPSLQPGDLPTDGSETP